MDLSISSDGDDLIVTIIPRDATGWVNVTVGDETFTGTVVDGKVVLKDTGLVSGNYNARVSYSGDNKYPSLTKNLNFNVPKADSVVIIPNVVSQGEDLIINIIPADATGTVSVTVDDETYTANVIDEVTIGPFII